MNDFISLDPVLGLVRRFNDWVYTALTNDTNLVPMTPVLQLSTAYISRLTEYDILFVMSKALLPPASRKKKMALLDKLASREISVYQDKQIF